MRIVNTYGLYEALKDEGHELPNECRDVHLQFGTLGKDGSEA